MNHLFKGLKMNRRECRGFFMLVIVLVLAMAIPVVYKSLHKQSTLPSDSLVVYPNLNERQPGNRHYAEVDRKDKPYPQRPPKNKATLFYFNPNNLPSAEWRRLGFSDAQIRVIKNYEAKGGRFRKKEDLAKVYSISASAYQRIEPYLIFPDTDEYKARAEKISAEPALSSGWKAKENVYLNLNTADSVELMLLQGIGPVLAQRIVKYRQALGGFYHFSQLEEVYGLPKETYESIGKHVYVDTSDVKKIRINSCALNELATHPYIKYRKAKYLYNYRKEHGKYRDLKSLSPVVPIDTVFLRKIEPYLEF
ncbi:ComEA family DNA-binding protein [Sphingobacterium sp. Mn56C]|uniref:ComEA family DNA-binding protein n=1 Tax=Sphingobacterium sp. Mn56C TaxID=3395261 RepID=UPI003BCB48C2